MPAFLCRSMLQNYYNFCPFVPDSVAVWHRFFSFGGESNKRLFSHFHRRGDIRVPPEGEPPNTICLSQNFFYFFIFSKFFPTKHSNIQNKAILRRFKRILGIGWYKLSFLGRKSILGAFLTFLGILTKNRVCMSRKMIKFGGNN